MDETNWAEPFKPEDFSGESHSSEDAAYLANRRFKEMLKKFPLITGTDFGGDVITWEARKRNEKKEEIK